MSGEFEKDFESGTERRRSRSGVPDSSGPGGGPPGPGEFQEDPERNGVAPPGDPPADGGEGAEWGAQGVEDFPGEVTRLPNLSGRRRRGRALKKPELPRGPLSAEKKLLLLDTWRRSGLPARDFAALTGLSRQCLYVWQRKFKLEGPAGLMEKPRGGPRGSRLGDLTQRTILMLKETHPEWGTERISQMLLRGPALGASPGAVARVLKDAGYQVEEVPTQRHPDRPREFERARPNELWQTDLFTFMLKRQNRRVYLVAFMDDHSRFLVGYGLHATQSTALVLEVLRAAIANFNPPTEILTDNGSQYVTWRGKSLFSRELERRGIRQVVARPRHPQTLGKIERFWGSLWRELIAGAVFQDMTDAHRRIGLYCDHYNFQRPHQGIGGLVPADRFFGASQEVLRTLKARVKENALELARHGIPRPPFYLTGNAGGRGFSVHAEGERVILQREEGEREEVELVGPKDDARAEAVLPEPLSASAATSSPVELDSEVPPPGSSPLDEGLRSLEESFREDEDVEEEGGES